MQIEGSNCGSRLVENEGFTFYEESGFPSLYNYVILIMLFFIVMLFSQRFQVRFKTLCYIFNVFK